VGKEILIKPYVCRSEELIKHKINKIIVKIENQSAFIGKHQ
jgi:hypothetical protein